MSDDKRVIVAWRNPANGIVISDQKKRQKGAGKGYPKFSEPIYSGERK